MEFDGDFSLQYKRLERVCEIYRGRTKTGWFVIVAFVLLFFGFVFGWTTLVIISILLIAGNAIVVFFEQERFREDSLLCDHCKVHISLLTPWVCQLCGCIHKPAFDLVSYISIPPGLASSIFVEPCQNCKKVAKGIYCLACGHAIPFVRLYGDVPQEFVYFLGHPPKSMKSDVSVDKILAKLNEDLQ